MKLDRLVLMQAKEVQLLMALKTHKYSQGGNRVISEIIH